MSKLLSLKMKDSIFKNTEIMAKKAKTSRNSYINQAVDFFNRLQKRRVLAKALKRESENVSSESLAVLQVFEAMEDDLPE